MSSEIRLLEILPYFWTNERCNNAGQKNKQASSMKILDDERPWVGLDLWFGHGGTMLWLWTFGD